VSTRCHILFTDGGTQLLTYKHSDGYPEAVIPLLRGFWEWYPRTERLEYLTATWFYYCKRGTEERLRNRYDAPTETDELTHNHPVALSYGICVDNEVHGDIEHFYEVNIEDRRVTHYTPEGIWFEDVESPAEIVSREPEETYRLTTSRIDDNQIEADNPSGPPATTDGGAETNTEQGQQGRCNNCGRTRNVTHTPEAGTPVGDYLGLVGSYTANVCNPCWNRIPEKTTQNDDFGLLEFEEWERKITTSESRFVSATWESDDHTVTLDVVGDGEWIVSWFGEKAGQTDDWHSRYEARQFAINQIQQMIRLIDSGMVSISEGVESEDRGSENTGERSASDCDGCGSTAETQWTVQTETPAGKYLGLSDGEVTELCDACMREVVEGIADEDDNTHNESIRGGENEC